MSKLTPIKFTLEDFKGQRDWIGPLFTTLNSFTEQLVASFNNRISVSDNLFQEIKEIRWKNSTGDFPLKFRSKFNLIPQGLVPIYLYNITLDTYSTQTPQVVWSFSGGDVSISNISGLTADSTYVIRLLILYG